MLGKELLWPEDCDTFYFCKSGHCCISDLHALLEALHSFISKWSLYSVLLILGQMASAQQGMAEVLPALTLETGL